MNVVDLQKKLIQAARQHPPGDKVPYAFEKRVRAVLRPLPTPDCWGQWAGALWRATVPCVVIMLLSTTLWYAFPSVSTPTNDLSQEIDNTVLAAIDQEPAAEVPE